MHQHAHCLCTGRLELTKCRVLQALHYGSYVTVPLHSGSYVMVPLHYGRYATVPLHYGRYATVPLQVSASELLHICSDAW